MLSFVYNEADQNKTTTRRAVLWDFPAILPSLGPVLYPQRQQILSVSFHTMAETDIAIEELKISDKPPADENTNSVKVKNVAVPLLRVEELKDEINSNASYTSGDDDHSHHEGSDDPDKSKAVEEEEFVPPSDELRDKIIHQVEFYFSDANILKDAFLLKHVRRNKQGYVSLKLITSFKKMKSLTKDYRVVAYSLNQSDLLEVNEEGKKVRRKAPLPDYDETTPSRSVVAVNLPMENPTIENVAELFSKCGEVALIRILKPGKPVPQDVKKHSSKHPEIGTTICAVVEFEKHDSAKIAAETMNNENNWRSGMRVVILAEPKKKMEKDKKEGKVHEANSKHENDDHEDGDKKKKRRAGRKNKRQFDNLHNDDSSCYSSGSEHDPPAHPHSTKSLSPNNTDSNRLSPSNSPRSSPRSSPKTSPRTQRRRLGPHGKSPLADHSPGGSPKPSPRSSPEVGRKRYDYSSGGDSTPSSPWVQRRLKAAQEISPLAGNSPAGSPMLNRRNPDGLPDGVIRFPKGPDGTRGFHLGRGKPRASTIA